MKRNFIVAFVCLVILGLPLFAVSSDYILGYRQGYADGLLNKPNQYPEASSQDNNWSIQYFVDSFGDITTEAYITQNEYSKGTFSNSATTNSNLSWYFIITEDSVAIVLREYGSHVVKGSSKYPDEYLINVKKPDGSTQEFAGKNYSDRILILSFHPYTSTIYEFLDILKNDQTIKLTVKKISDYSISSYNLGAFDCFGFSSIYNQLLEE